MRISSPEPVTGTAKTLSLSNWGSGPELPGLGSEQLPRSAARALTGQHRSLATGLYSLLGGRSIEIGSLTAGNLTPSSRSSCSY